MHIGTVERRGGLGYSYIRFEVISSWKEKYKRNKKLDLQWREFVKVSLLSLPKHHVTFVDPSFSPPIPSKISGI